MNRLLYFQSNLLITRSIFQSEYLLSNARVRTYIIHTVGSSVLNVMRSIIFNTDEPTVCIMYVRTRTLLRRYCHKARGITRVPSRLSQSARHNSKKSDWRRPVCTMRLRPLLNTVPLTGPTPSSCRLCPRPATFRSLSDVVHPYTRSVSSYPIINYQSY